MSRLIEIRWHGRGGQGAKTASLLLADAAFNTGMYILEPQYISMIPEDTFFHMTHLAEAMMAKGLQVGMYPISENSFLDMGEFEEMKKMEARINSGSGS